MHDKNVLKHVHLSIKYINTFVWTWNRIDNTKLPWLPYGIWFESDNISSDNDIISELFDTIPVFDTKISFFLGVLIATNSSMESNEILEFNESETDIC